MQNLETTDMYFIAALLAYGFDPFTVDTSDPDKQIYSFDLEVCKPVYALNGKEAKIELLNAEEIEMLYGTSKLLFSPNYAQILKTIKYSIISRKVRGKSGQK